MWSRIDRPAFLFRLTASRRRLRLAVAVALLAVKRESKETAESAAGLNAQMAAVSEGEDARLGGVLAYDSALLKFGS